MTNKCIFTKEPTEILPMKRMYCFMMIIIALSSCETKHIKTYDSPARTIVAGRVINHQTELQSVTLSINWVGFPQEEVEAPLDSTGSFAIGFLTYVPVDAWLTYQVNSLVVLRPGDSLYVEIDGAHDDRPELLASIKYAGTAAAINEQVSVFQKKYYESGLHIYADDKLEVATKNYAPERFRAFADSLRDQETKFLDDFITQYQPGDFVKSWATYSIYEDYYGILTFYPNDHRKANVLKQDEWNVPVSYYDYFNEPLSIDPENGLQSGYAVSGYLDKYLSYIWRLTRDELKATGNQSKSAFDSTALKNIIEHTPEGIFRESLITHVFSRFIEDSEIGSFSRFKSIADRHVHSRFLREPLFSMYEKAKKEIATSGQMASTRVASLKTFLDGLFTNKKGKVVYVDIWATWCGPCRDEFPYSKQLYNQFRDQVEFVYICIDSEEPTYKNALTKYQLPGTTFFLDKQQSQALKEKLQLKGVPHYLLIDRDGKLVADGFEMRPSERATAEKISLLVK